MIRYACACLAVFAGMSLNARAEESAPAPEAAVTAPEPQTETPKEANPMVTLKTSKGDIVIELFTKEAPLTVANFLQYVDDGFYTGTIFHRVINNFMIQGGGFTKDMRQKSTKAPIKNEAGNGLKNTRGTLAMARTSDPNSATAQFFINVVDNGFLDFKSPDARGIGYCVFGKVVSGMEAVDAIKVVRTAAQDVPVETIEILEASRTKTP